MNKNLSVLLLALTVSIGLAGALFSCLGSHDKPVKVLILSGSNNHDWAKTTPFLERIYSETGLFSADITERPDTLKSSDFMQYDVVVSNWNSFPKTDVRLPEATEKAFLSYLEKGGGLVTFHASSSAFYEWPEFKEVRTAEWLMDSTWQIGRAHV